MNCFKCYNFVQKEYHNIRICIDYELKFNFITTFTDLSRKLYTV